MKRTAQKALVIAAFVILITVWIGGNIVFTVIRRDRQNQEPVQATQLVYMPDVSKAPTADQFNGLLHALQNAHLMQGVPVDKTPKSNWLHWWGFP